MKIALVNTHLQSDRGSDTVVHALAEQLASEHQVVVFALGHVSEGPHSYKLVSGGGRNPIERIFRATLVVWNARRFAAAADVTNCHHAFISLLLPRSNLVTTYHGYLGGSPTWLGSKLGKMASALLRRHVLGRAFRRSKATTVVSQSLVPEVQAAGVDPVVIYNGVDFSGQGNNNLGENNQPYFLYVGRLSPEKGIERLIKMYRLSPLEDIPLVIAGDGPERERLKELMPSSRFRLLGRVERNKLPALYKSALAFITASPNETFCLPVIEAAAHGCPSIAPRGGAMPEVICEGQTGYLYDSDDEFHQHLTAVFHQKTTGQTTTESACRSWASRFAWHHRAAEYLQLFEQISSNRHCAMPTRRQAGKAE